MSDENDYETGFFLFWNRYKDDLCNVIIIIDFLQAALDSTKLTTTVMT